MKQFTLNQNNETNTMRLGAHGKIFILGEYAVIKYGFFMAMPLPNRVWVTLVENHQTGNQESKSIGIIQEKLSSSRHPLLLAARSILEQTSKDMERWFQHFSIEMDIREMLHVEGDNVRKLGMGSSAAAAVALSRLLVMNLPTSACDALHRELLHSPWRFWSLWSTQKNHLEEQSVLWNMTWQQYETTVLFALAMHQQAAHGLGSGADVMISSMADIVLQVPGTMLACNKTGLMTLKIPDALKLVFYDTGFSTDTRRILQHLEEKPISKVRLDDIHRIVLRGIQNCVENNHTGLLQTVDEAYSYLQEIEKENQIEIISEEHRRHYLLAKDSGGSAKPCGAGGGDLGMMLLPESAKQRFQDLSIMRSLLL